MEGQVKDARIVACGKQVVQHPQNRVGEGAGQQEGQAYELGPTGPNVASRWQRHRSHRWRSHLPSPACTAARVAGGGRRRQDVPLLLWRLTPADPAAEAAFHAPPTVRAEHAP